MVAKKKVAPKPAPFVMNEGHEMELKEISKKLHHDVMFHGVKLVDIFSALKGLIVECNTVK